MVCCCRVDRLLRRRRLAQPAAAGMHEPPAPPACTRLTVQINCLPLAAHIPPYIHQSAFRWNHEWMVRNSLSKQMHAAHTACGLCAQPWQKLCTHTWSCKSCP